MLPPGYHSQQAATILPTLMPVPPEVPPIPLKAEVLDVGTAATGCLSSAARLSPTEPVEVGLRSTLCGSREVQIARMIRNSFLNETDSKRD
jgi:hypothetical protein